MEQLPITTSIEQVGVIPTQAVQQSELTIQVCSQLLQLLKSPNIQVKHGCLNAILQYTSTQKSKQLFIDSCLFVQINKIISIPALTTICLSTLIHFSPNNKFQKEFERFVEQLIFGLKQAKDLAEELTLLLLLNITQFDTVINKLVGKDDNKGFFMEILFGLLQLRPHRRWLIVNIFVNVSSVEIGRKYVTEEKIYLRFFDFINNQKQETRLGVLKLLRNASFEWQTQQIISQMLKSQHDVINKIAQHLIYVISAGKLCKQDQILQIEKIQAAYQPLAQKSSKIISLMKFSSKQKAYGQICLMIDFILVLSNSNFNQRKVSIKHDPLRAIIQILKFSDLEEDYKDKLEALEIFCF